MAGKRPGVRIPITPHRSERFFEYLIVNSERPYSSKIPEREPPGCSNRRIRPSADETADRTIKQWPEPPSGSATVFDQA